MNKHSKNPIAAVLEKLNKDVHAIAKRIAQLQTQGAEQYDIHENFGLAEAKVKKFTKLADKGRVINNPRQLQVIKMLIDNICVTREKLDKELGVQNSPDIIFNLKRKCGWTIWSFHGIRAREIFENLGHFYHLPDPDKEIAKKLLADVELETELESIELV